MNKTSAVFVLDRDAYELVYGPEERQRIAQLVNVLGPAQTSQSILENPKLLGAAEVLISGWGGPMLDGAFLDKAPRLKLVLFGAGSVSPLMTDAAWKRGIVVTSAYAANAIPVAEYTLSMILFSLKHGWPLSRQTRERRSFPARDKAPGCYGSTVGLVSLGIIARTLLRLLKQIDVKVIAFDPFVTTAEAAALGVELTTLAELFRAADVVSIHTPHLAETEGMIDGSHILSMKEGATLINTARGAVIREEEMLQAAARRPDLQFILDVLKKEPPEADSSLYTLPNIVLTPHIAGSAGRECLRMGRYMIEELERYLDGKPLHWRVTPELAARSSHRGPGLSATTFVKSKTPVPA
ncbi:MAG TPA: hydroxyacid dehydrogenase [Tepidisphaeraceae bacterium]|nr:hydroxyacid dehydrogenase [Tepidisphaeraceae bacterium]